VAWRVHVRNVVAINSPGQWGCRCCVLDFSKILAIARERGCAAHGGALTVMRLGTMRTYRRQSDHYARLHHIRFHFESDGCTCSFYFERDAMPSEWRWRRVAPSAPLMARGAIELVHAGWRGTDAAGTRAPGGPGGGLGISLLWNMRSAKASPKAAFLLTSRPSIPTLALYCQSSVSRIPDRGWSI
jgi:hypothetical protein